MRGHPFLLAVFLAVQSTAVAAAPSQQPSPRQTAQAVKVKAQVQKRGTHERSRVKVTLHDKSQQKGRISEIGEDSFSLTNDKTGQVSSISYVDVESVRGSGLSDRARFRLGVGVVAAVAITLVVVAAVHQKGPCCYYPL